MFGATCHGVGDVRDMLCLDDIWCDSRSHDMTAILIRVHITVVSKSKC